MQFKLNQWYNFTEKLTDKVTQALLGYRNVLRNGDDELGHIIVDPATLANQLWHIDNWPKVR